MATDEKIVCQTPTPNKKPTRIDKWKYDLVRGTILKALPKNGEGMPFKELPKEVEKRLARSELEQLGSVAWYTTTVKLDMEVKNEILRIKDISQQRLLRK